MKYPSSAHKTHRWRLRLGERRVLLIVTDFIMAVSALLIGLYYWQLGQEIESFVEFLIIRPEKWFFLLPFVWLLLLVDTYDTHRASNWQATVRGVTTAALIGLGIYLLVYFTSSPGSLPRRGVAGFVVTASILTLSWRLIYIQIFTDPQFMRRVILVGAGSTGQVLLKVVNDLWPPPFYMVGLVDDDPDKIGTVIEGYMVLGGSESILELIRQESITDVVVAITGRMNPRMFQMLLDAQEQGTEITRFPTAYEQLMGRVPVQHLEADWILRSFVDETQVSSFYEIFKRLLDIVGGMVGVLILILMSPFISLAIFLESGRPIVFTQTRAGKGGHPYSILKFRTMVDGNGSTELTKEDDNRTTTLGRFLRKSRLDEWPQFINVLRGEMSLVGPRPEQPELMEHFQREIPFYRGRLLDKPGITGWAQINFGYAASLEEMVVKLEYDLYYIKHRSIWLDISIILRTAGTVFGLRGR